MTSAETRFTGTMPMTDALRIDSEALASYMAANVEGFGGGPVEVRQFRGGQSNPTYHVTAGDVSYVVRRKPPGQLLPSAHAVDREYRVISALADTAVPVPRAFALCTDPGVIGTPFYVMEHLAGRIFWDATLSKLPHDERAAIYDAMNIVIAALHSVDHRAVGLGDFGRPDGYIARQVARWSKQYRASETETIEAMDRLIDWLPAHIPSQQATSIVHGDYRLDNMVFHPTEPRIIGVLDWELSTIGDSVADFAYHCMIWRLTGSELRALGDVDVAALGIPPESAYVAAYCRRTGRERIDHWGFYLAYNMFRLAAIFQGIAKRVVDGTAASAHGAAMGALARPMAESAWRQVEALGAD